MTNFERVNGAEDTVIKTVAQSEIDLLGDVMYLPNKTNKVAIIVQGEEYSEDGNYKVDKAIAEAFLSGASDEGLEYMTSRLKHFYDMEHGEGSFTEFVKNIEPQYGPGEVRE